MTVTTHPISGTSLKPDLSDVNIGNWTIGIYSDTGYAFITDPAFDDGTWVSGTKTWTTLDDGTLTISLPETDGTDFAYWAQFESYDKSYTSPVFPFDLTAAMTWTDIMTNPSPIPITPAALAQAQAYRDQAQGYAQQAAGSVSLVAWAPTTVYAAGNIRQAPDGSTIKRNANGTSRASFDATEQAAWTPTVAASGTLDNSALNAAFAPGGVAGNIGRKLVQTAVCRGYGHSYMYGSTTSSLPPAIIGQSDFLSVLAGLFGLVQDNQGVSGASLADMASTGDVGDIEQAEARGTTFDPAGLLVVLMYLLNDAAQLGHTYSIMSASPKQALRVAVASIRAMTAWQYLDSSLAYTGTWSSTTISTRNSGSGVKYSATNGDTVTWTPPTKFPGGTLSIPFIAWGDGGSATWTTVVNGITYTCNTASFARSGNHPTVGLMRIPNVKRTNGPITFTVSNVVAGAAPAVFNCVWLEAPEALCPIIPLVGQPKPLDYTSQNTAPGGPVTDAGVDVINQVQQEVCAEFGSRVLYIDTSSLDHRVDCFESGNVHPSLLGHQLIAQLIYNAVIALFAIIPTRAVPTSTTTGLTVGQTAYTPVLDGTSTTQGNATVSGTYSITNGKVAWEAIITLGSTSVIGTSLRVSLPVNELSGKIEVGRMVARVSRSGVGYAEMHAQLGVASAKAQLRLTPKAERARTVTTTNASTTVTAPAGSFNADDVGAQITGTGIPAGATIATVTPGAAGGSDSITISAAATASGTVVARLNYLLASPTATRPLTWTSGDALYVSGEYFAA